LWPVSRTARPKQFLPLVGPLSLYQQTLKRVADPALYKAPVVLSNAEYRFLVGEQAQEAGVDLEAIVLEPEARNTAAAIAAAAAFVQKRFGRDAILHILPSDHAVTVDEGYRESVRQGAEAAAAGHLVTFGIVPTRPETGYGYIEGGKPVLGPVLAVKRFVEKPDSARAEELVAHGGYYWNSGMFMLRADVFLAECGELAPETLEAARGAVDAAKLDLDFTRLDPEAFSRAPNISVDYAIFERTKKAAVLPVSYAWSDLGSWDAVWAASAQDEAGNAVLGPATLGGTSKSLVISERAHVAVDGLDDVAVIASEDAIYVGRLSQAQSVGALVKKLKASRETAGLTEIHQTAYRPWGGYTSILVGDRFQVKRLFVKPGKKLSLQKHHHRSEHWVVVRGTAEVTVDGEITALHENESIYLPIGCTHRLANPGKILLELIEVQTGSYLGEDDIIRIEDEFGRN